MEGATMEPQGGENKGFLFVLFVVIGLALLAFIFLWLEMRGKGDRSQAKGEVMQLCNSVRQYEHEYGRFPVTESGDSQALQTDEAFNSLGKDGVLNEKSPKSW